MTHPRNIIGPRLRELREVAGLTQEAFAARCNLLGWNLSRETLAKIETQVRWISDCELLCLARALRLPIDQLLVSTKHSPQNVRKFFAAIDKTS